MSCMRKQREPLVRLKLTTNQLRVSDTTNYATTKGLEMVAKQL